jgi:hypothetical protein
VIHGQLRFEIEGGKPGSEERKGSLVEEGKERKEREKKGMLRGIAPAFALLSACPVSFYWAFMTPR